MPEIHEIDEFKNDFVRLGNEPAIRAERGEPMPDIPVPDTQAADDIGALFEEDEASEDLLEGLFDLSDEEGLESFDEGPAAAEPEPEPEMETEAEPELDEFSIPEELTGGLAGDLESEDLDFMDESTDSSLFGEDEEDFELPAEAEEVPEAEAVPEEVELPGDFELPEDLSFSDDIEAEEFSEAEDIEDFSLPGDLGGEDFSFDESDEETFPEPEAGEFPEEPLEAEDEGEPAEASFEDELAGFDSLSISDDDDFGADLGEMPGAEEEISFDEDLADEESAGEDFSLEDFSLEEIDDGDIEATEFSLGDLGQEFGVDEEVETDLGQLEDLDVPLAVDTAELGDAFDDENYAIPDDEWAELKKTLGLMPRNLKIIIEELIGEKNLSGENLDKLLKILISGGSAKEVAALVSKITGKKVKVPLQYERKTAEAFEKEKSSFGYIFRKNFIPMFRTAAIVAAALGFLLFIGFRFIYKPLHAESLYRKGYEEIYNGNNQQANAYFDRAFGERRKKKWFFDYAEAFSENKQYVLAEEKYEQLLTVYPGDRQGILDYAGLEFRILGKYPEAERLLTGLLFDDQLDYDARLLLGDNYMEWAREIDESHYEDARFNYAKLIEQYGRKDSLLFRMMRYFIRTDNYEEVMKLYGDFQANTRAAVEPDVYAELAGYLIDRKHLEDVREILMRARSVREDIPEIHYELARYFDIIDIPAEEEKALLAAVWLFENTNPLTRTRTGLLIDSYNRYGKVLYQKEMYIDAEEYFSKAAMNYEDALAAGQLSPKPMYGTIYSNLGDLAYYISGNYEQALGFFERAEQNGYSPYELKYKKGFIYYNDEDYRKALVEFYDTAGGFSVDRQLLYSTANTLFNRNDYYLAEGYYTHLKDILEKEYSSISYLLIDEIPEHRILVENMMKVSNNLGVAKYMLYQRNRDPEKSAEAMVLFTDASEYYDKLARDPNSLIAPETVNLSYLNSRAVFYPVPDYSPQIYQDIPKDLEKPEL